MEKKTTEKVLFNRHILNNIVGKNRSNTFIMALRKDNLGVQKMTKVMRKVYKSSKPVEVISSMYHFDCDEIIEHYEKKKKRYKEDSSLISRPTHNEAWDETIRITKKIKKYIQDSK